MVRQPSEIHTHVTWTLNIRGKREEEEEEKEREKQNIISSDNANPNYKQIKSPMNAKA